MWNINQRSIHCIFAIHLILSPSLIDFIQSSSQRFATLIMWKIWRRRKRNRKLNIYVVCNIYSWASSMATANNNGISSIHREIRLYIYICMYLNLNGYRYIIPHTEERKRKRKKKKRRERDTREPGMLKRNRNHVESTDLGERDATELLTGMELERLMEAERWKRQRKEPWWVVGEHRQWWPLGDFVSPSAVPFGDVVTLMMPWEAIILQQRWENEEQWRNMILDKTVFHHHIYSGS